MEIDHDFLDPLRIKVVVNDLCATELLPHVTLALVEDDEGVRE